MWNKYYSNFKCWAVLYCVLAYSAVLCRAMACSGVLWRALACSGMLCCALLCRTQVLDNRNPLADNRTDITWIIFKNSSALMYIFLKLFVHELLYKFIDSIDLKWCIGHWFTHPVIKKMVLTSEINIIATSSAELCSAVFWRALACSGVLWRALAFSGVLWSALLWSGVLCCVLACSAVFWRALVCSGVLWRALACSAVLCCAEIKCRTKELK